MKRKSVGFTLIELLVVIAIIAILAAILFPVFGFAVPYPHLFDPAKPSTKLSAIPRFSRTMLMCDSYTMRVNSDTNAPVEVGYPVVFCRACNDWGYNEELPDGNVAGRHGCEEIHQRGRVGKLGYVGAFRQHPTLIVRRYWMDPAKLDRARSAICCVGRI